MEPHNEPSEASPAEPNTPDDEAGLATRLEARLTDAVGAPKTPQRPWPAWRYGLVMALACAWILIQYTVPLSANIHHPSEVRTDFSWDMFAVRRDCKPCRIMIKRRGHPLRRYGWGKIYNTTYQVARSRTVARMPLVAREVCRREAAANRADSEVTIDCKCTYNKEPRVYDLDPLKGGDYCTPEAAARFDSP